LNCCSHDYYGILKVAPTADFSALKRAYYRRAKECHPDRFPGRPEKEEEFRLLVEAFDVLSDPISRRSFDRLHPHLSSDGELPFVFTDDSSSVMDTVADDILEELIVGNTVPRNTTLQTLLLDLGRTEKFCLYREAKTFFFSGKFRHACELFSRATMGSPNNILYRYYLARSLTRLGRVKAAREHLEIALQFGAMRHPPQRLARIRRELQRLRREGGLLQRWSGRQLPEPDLTDDSADAQMRRQLARAMMRLQEDRARRGRLLRD